MLVWLKCRLLTIKHSYCPVTDRDKRSNPEIITKCRDRDLLVKVWDKLQTIHNLVTNTEGKNNKQKDKMHIEILPLHCLCRQCKSSFPKVWVGKPNGAIQVGANIFCSQKCHNVYTVENTPVLRNHIPKITGKPIFEFL